MPGGSENRAKRGYSSGKSAKSPDRKRGRSSGTHGRRGAGRSAEHGRGRRRQCRCRCHRREPSPCSRSWRRRPRPPRAWHLLWRLPDRRLLEESYHTIIPLRFCTLIMLISFCLFPPFVLVIVRCTHPLRSPRHHRALSSFEAPCALCPCAAGAIPR